METYYVAAESSPYRQLAIPARRRYYCVQCRRGYPAPNACPWHEEWLEDTWSPSFRPPPPVPARPRRPPFFPRLLPYESWAWALVAMCLVAMIITLPLSGPALLAYWVLTRRQARAPRTL